MGVGFGANVQDYFVFMHVVGEEKNMSKIEQRLNRVKKSMDKNIESAGRFRGEYLSLMFGGMALQKMFGGQISQMMDMFGITELYSTLLQSFLIPVFTALLPYLIYIFEAFNGLSEETKTFIGIVMVAVTVIGFLASVIGMAVLAMDGLLVIFKGVTLASLGWVAVILVAVAAIIYLAIKFEWFRDILLFGLKLVLLPLTSVFILLCAIIDAYKFLSGEMTISDAISNRNSRIENMVPGGQLIVGALTQTINNDNNVASSLDVDLLNREMEESQQAFMAKQFNTVGGGV